MMEPFERIDIQELPLSVPFFRRRVEDFLGSNGLRLGEVDLYLAVLSEEGTILAGGGLQRDLVKCLAVSETARSLGLSVPLISRLISVAAERGFTNVKVFTKPGNLSVFESLGFKCLAQAPKAVLLENGRGLEDYCAMLRAHPAAGVIVMNANPFTQGHRYLVEQASLSLQGQGPLSSRSPEERRNLCVIPVREDLSRFPYSERLDMIRQGCAGLADVVEGSDYQISAATFPTYFLKDLSDAAETQMRLDIDLFGRHIAPALGVAVRFVGSEPADPLTARYNALMKELLPAYGVQVVEIPRLADAEGPVTASRVREWLDGGHFADASALTPASTRPYLLASLAERALRMELDAPLKPGLVGPDSNGAHRDMDYALMRKGIDAIRPFFPRLSLACSPEEVRQLGIDAEHAMLAATGGVNTHRGAIFALGLALNVSGRRMERIDSHSVMQSRVAELAHAVLSMPLNDSELHSTALSHGAEAVHQYGVLGAREMALGGYRPLFEDWLPFYRTVKARPYGLQLTLMRIVSTLDDTCVIHRVGYERAQEVKAEAGEVVAHACDAGTPGSLETGSSAVIPDLLRALCVRYAAEGLSPGGAADMLVLTTFMDSILN